MNHLSNQIAQSVIYIDNEKELWKDLQERFSKRDHFKIFDIIQEIHSIKQGERIISEFFTDLKIFLERIGIFETCTKLQQ